MLNLNIPELIHGLDSSKYFLFKFTTEGSVLSNDYCVFKSKAVPISLTAFINHV